MIADTQKRLTTPLMLRRVKGNGMYPTLEKGQLVLVRRRSYCKVNDIVVFVQGGVEKVKRVSGIEGDFLYLLGDNPQFSTDSRQYGYVNRENIVGTIIFPREGTR